MFAGAGDFFRPVDPRKEISPSSPIRPVSRSGDEPQKRSGDELKDTDHTGQDSAAENFPEGISADSFSGDAVELSIAALFVLLAGQTPPQRDNNPPPFQTPDTGLPAPFVQETHRAFDAYQRAASALPPAAAPHRSAQTGGQDAGGEIFYMLAALEKAGVQALTVAGGQTIYAALRAQCRAHDIALAVPAAAPDNNAR
ncbi:MAG: hypothetical protein ACK4PK_11505 [Alphaproteobacteria bacterium]